MRFLKLFCKKCRILEECAVKENMSVGKYQKRLFKIFLLIGICVVVVAISLAGAYFSKSQERQYDKALEQSMSTKMNMAQTRMSVIMTGLEDLMQNPVMNAWASSESRSDYYYNSVQACDQIKNITSGFSQVNYEVAATILDDSSFIISKNGTSERKRYFKDETCLTDKQVHEIFSYFKSHNGSMTIPCYRNNSLHEIYYILKSLGSRHDLLYIVRIPQKTIFGNESDQHFVLLDQSGKKVLAYSQKNNDFMNLCVKILPKTTKLLSGSRTQIMRKNVFLEDFTGVDWRIIYIFDDINMDVLELVKIIVPLTFCLLILAMILAKTVTARLYKPIKEIMSDVAPSDMPGSKELDEFEIIRQNADNIKVLSHELQDALKEKNTLEICRYYRDLLFGIEDLENHKDNDDKRYCVALLEFQDEGYSDESLLFLHKNIIDAYTREHIGMHYVSVSHDSCTIILEMTEADTPDTAKILMQSLLNTLGEEVEIKVSISEIMRGSRNVSLCYSQALKILDYKYLYDKSEILTMQQIEGLDATTYYYPLVTENQLILSMIDGHLNAGNIYKELIRENIQYRNLSPQTLQNFIFALIGTIGRTFQELKTTPKELLGVEIDFAELYSQWNNVTIIAQLQKIIEGIAEAVHARNGSTDDLLLKEMLEYIHTNYSDDIMLTDMANHFNISPKYCSALFKKLRNDTFKNYLNRYRIERAQEMLRENPSIKISDLCKKVGFNSANSFIRVFSKYVGITPKAFAEKVVQE